MDDIKVGDVFVPVYSDGELPYAYVEVLSFSYPYNRIVTSHGEFGRFTFRTFFKKFNGYYPLFKLFQGAE